MINYLYKTKKRIKEFFKKRAMEMYNVACVCVCVCLRCARVRAFVSECICDCDCGKLNENTYRVHLWTKCLNFLIQISHGNIFTIRHFLHIPPVNLVLSMNYVPGSDCCLAIRPRLLYPVFYLYIIFVLFFCAIQYSLFALLYCIYIKVYLEI